MVILVTANNYLLMFVGWEGVGVCSYLLICFWFTRIAANQSALSAFLTNRVGDCFLTIGMFAILWAFGNLDYATVFSLAPYMNENIITIVGICLLIGAMAKSSQVGLHVWLPMAMEGPTPVSALIHAATMVTAGVYLLMRSSPLIEYSSTVLMLCLWLGAITTVFSSLIGLFQQDIKKVIAYSTMSQLGMMVIAVGLSCYNIALFHLVNHAFYKALLFLGAGAVIHAVADNQDFRRYGGLRPFLPLTYSVMLIASLSLVAFPFMTGFYSKDFILESAYGQYYFSSTIVYIIATIGAMFTTLYSVKVLYLTFLANPNGPLTNYKIAHEGDIFMSLPLIILAVFSIFFGFITKDIFIGLGSGFFSDNALFIHPSHEIMLDTEFGVPTIFKLLPLVLTVLLSIISIVLSENLPSVLIYFKLSRVGYNIFSFFNQRFLIELFYNKYITGTILKLGGQTTKVIDKGSIEYIGPYGLEKGLLSISNTIAKLSTGVITSYALYILVWAMFFMLSYYFEDNITILLFFLSLSIAFFDKNSVYLAQNNKDILHSVTIYGNSKDYPKPHAFTSTSLNCMMGGLIHRKLLRRITKHSSELEGYKNELRTLNKIEDLNKVLNDEEKNHSLKQLKKHYEAFFDDDSYNSTQQGLKDLREYLISEIKANQIQLNKAKFDLSKFARSSRSAGENPNSIPEENQNSIPEENPNSIPEESSSATAESSNVVAETSNTTVAETSNTTVAETSNVRVAETSNTTVAETSNATVAETSNATVGENSNATVRHISRKGKEAVRNENYILPLPFSIFKSTLTFLNISYTILSAIFIFISLGFISFNFLSLIPDFLLDIIPFCIYKYFYVLINSNLFISILNSGLVLTFIISVIQIRSIIRKFKLFYILGTTIRKYIRNKFN